VIDIAAIFGDNLRRFRKRAGMSQEEVSWRAGLHRTEISQIERGMRLPRVDTVAKLAGALEIEPGKLFEGIAWEPGEVRYGRFQPSEDRQAGTGSPSSAINSA
jgi:transcriptional regulator with XRE-family HTH domain